MAAADIKRVKTPTLEIAYEESGAPTGTPAILLHGFPYDPRCYDEVAAILAAAGHRVLVPYLRGYGPTRFLSSDTPRSGEQAALGNDLKEFMDALGIASALLAGYDWGGRAACVVAALWPDRAKGLVTANGYNIQNIAASAKPLAPEQEHRYWYQYYFHTERGRAGLTANRRELTRLIWRLWSPTWNFDEATLDRTVASFDNPDFVDVVIHSYRHRYGYVAGDPALAGIERKLALTLPIGVPAIVLHGAVDGVLSPEDTVSHARHFTEFYERRVLDNVGHNAPQEDPRAFADAVLELARRS
jgi:pimeloyl-ACP methyl ester carboxylesterase